MESFSFVFGPGTNTQILSSRVRITNIESLQAFKAQNTHVFQATIWGINDDQLRLLVLMPPKRHSEGC